MLCVDRLVSRHQYRHDGDQHARRPYRRKRDKDVKVNKGSASLSEVGAAGFDVYQQFDTRSGKRWHGIRGW